MSIKKSIVLLLSCLLLNGVIAQQKNLNKTHTITLKDGSTYQGIIKEYVEGDKLVLQLGPNIVKTIKDKHIKKITDDGLHQPDVETEVAYISENSNDIIQNSSKLYFEYNAQLMLGSSDFYTAAQDGDRLNKIDPGIGSQLIGGYQLHRLVGVGAGVGLDYYYLNSGETILPIFADVRGYFLKNNFSPIYKLQAGYGFAFKDEDRGMLDAEGGLMLYPALGFKFGKNAAAANFLLDFGVKIQKADYIFEADNVQTWWNIKDVRIANEMIYRRFVVRSAILF